MQATSIRRHSRVTHSATIDGVNVDLTFEPYYEDYILAERVGDKIVVAYLVQDSDCGDIDDMLGDGMGKLCSFHRHAPKEEHREGLAAMGRDEYGNSDGERNPNAVLLDCYDHGGQRWSISVGGGMQCQWDTANGTGVWIPDGYLLEQIEGDVKSGLDRTTQAEKYCRQFLDSYNSIISGDVYGCVVEIFDKVGDDDDIEWESDGKHDACWGHLGSDYALDTLKSEYFEPTVKRLQEDQV